MENGEGFGGNAMSVKWERLRRERNECKMGNASGGNAMRRKRRALREDEG